MTPQDLRSVSDKTLKLYLYSVGAWAVFLLGSFVMGRIGLALSFCYPLAIWMGVMTVWWWLTTRKRFTSEDLTGIEVKAGVLTIGRILAGTGVIPGIIFLALKPLEPAAWGTCFGVAVTSGAAWQLVHLSTKMKSPKLSPIILLCSWTILPINATGAVSLGAFMQWFEQAKQLTLP